NARKKLARTRARASASSKRGTPPCMPSCVQTSILNEIVLSVSSLAICRARSLRCARGHARRFRRTRFHACRFRRSRVGARDARRAMLDACAATRSRFLGFAVSTVGQLRCARARVARARALASRAALPTRTVIGERVGLDVVSDRAAECVLETDLRRPAEQLL